MSPRPEEVEAARERMAERKKVRIQALRELERLPADFRERMHDYLFDDSRSSADPTDGILA